MEREQDQEQQDGAIAIPHNVDRARREGKLVADQAQALREAGQRTWKPTWQEIGRQDAAIGAGAGPNVGRFDMSKYQRQQRQTAAQG